MRALLHSSSKWAISATQHRLPRLLSSSSNTNEIPPLKILEVMKEIKMHLAKEPVIKELETVAQTIPNESKRTQFVFDEVVKIQHDLWEKFGVNPELGFNLLHSQEGWDHLERQDMTPEMRQDIVESLIDFDVLEENLVLSIALGKEKFQEEFVRRQVIQQVYLELNQLPREEDKVKLLEDSMAQSQNIFKTKLGDCQTNEELAEKFAAVLNPEEQRVIVRGSICRDILSGNFQDEEEEESDHAHSHSHNHGHSHGGKPCTGHHQHEEEEEEDVVPPVSGRKWKKLGD